MTMYLPGQITTSQLAGRVIEEVATKKLELEGRKDSIRKTERGIYMTAKWHWLSGIVGLELLSHTTLAEARAYLGIRITHPEKLTKPKAAYTSDPHGRAKR